MTPENTRLLQKAAFNVFRKNFSFFCIFMFSNVCTIIKSHFKMLFMTIKIPVRFKEWFHVGNKNKTVFAKRNIQMD